MENNAEQLAEIRREIKNINERINAGISIINDCKRQQKILKAKLKEYERIENIVSSSAADGNL